MILPSSPLRDSTGEGLTLDDLHIFVFIFTSLETCDVEVTLFPSGDLEDIRTVYQPNIWSVNLLLVLAENSPPSILVKD